MPKLGDAALLALAQASPELRELRAALCGVQVMIMLVLLLLLRLLVLTSLLYRRGAIR